MTLSQMQQGIDFVYEQILNKEKIKSNFKDEELAVVSAPFLINIPESYFTAKKKILYIGKETNIWWGKLKHYVQVTDSLDILKKRYTAEFEGGEVKTSKDLTKTKIYKGKNWNNSAFFSKFIFFEKSIQNSCVLWTNLLKMDSGAKGYAKNSIHDDRIRELSKEILKKEIEILKPDAIVFVTATSTNIKQYDEAIKNTLDNNFSNSKVIRSKEFWIFEYEGIKCYRTLHPLSYQYKNKNAKHDYYQDIVDDINNGIALFE